MGIQITYLRWVVRRFNFLRQWVSFYINFPEKLLIVYLCMACFQAIMVPEYLRK